VEVTDLLDRSCWLVEVTDLLDRSCWLVEVTDLLDWSFCEQKEYIVVWDFKTPTQYFSCYRSTVFC